MKNNFFEINWSKYIFWHLYLIWPTQNSEESNLRLSFGFWKFFISVGLWKTKNIDSGLNMGDETRYGFMYNEGVFFLFYGKGKIKYFDMPWKWQIIRHDLLLPNGEVYESNRWDNKGKPTDRHYNWYEILTGWDDEQVKKSILDKCTRQIELDHYTKDGRRQQAIITLKGEEREWRWLWFTWIPLFNKVQRTVDCDSNVEIGKKAGSWKGGLMGWSCEWDINESMESAFRRWYDKWDGN